ncbi:hypothetical protein [Microbulbifer taiwanensis]|uniref:hypothetical protein n=1 Tax=Microbulbifer taiwanensis TaxID=986746 RepID=UPI003621DF81
MAAFCTTVSLPSTSTCTASSPWVLRRSKSRGITTPTLISPRRSMIISCCGLLAFATGSITPVANKSMTSWREPLVCAWSAMAAGRWRGLRLMA